MKSNGKMISLFLVFLILLVSGCTSNNTETTKTSLTEGLVIKNLEMQDTFAGSSTSITFDVENVGGWAASNACIQVFGQHWIDGVGQAWYSADGTEGCLTGASLLPPSEGAPGDRFFVVDDYDVDITNPVTDSGSDYGITARLYYKYRTRALIDQLEVLSQDEYRRQQRLGELETSEVQAEYTDGPLKVTVQTTEPVRANDGTVTLRINLVHVGDGRLFDPMHAIGKTDGTNGYSQIDMSDYNKVKLSGVTVQGGTVVGSDGSRCSPGKDVRVPDGSQGSTIVCKIQLNSIIDQTNIGIALDFDYGYMEKYGTSVNVKPTFRDFGTGSQDTETSTDTSTSSATGAFTRGMAKVIPYFSNLF